MQEDETSEAFCRRYSSIFEVFSWQEVLAFAVYIIFFDTAIGVMRVLVIYLEPRIAVYFQPYLLKISNVGYRCTAAAYLSEPIFVISGLGKPDLNLPSARLFFNSDSY